MSQPIASTGRRQRFPAISSVDRSDASEARRLAVLGVSAVLLCFLALTLFSGANSRFLVLGAQLFAAVSVVSALADARCRRLLIPAMAGVAYTWPGVVVASSMSVAVAGWLNMSLGLTAGCVLGSVSVEESTKGILVRSMCAVLLSTAGLVIVNFVRFGADSSHSFGVQWGRSNYVSAVLIVGSFFVASKFVADGQPRSGWALMTICSVASLAILSRGSVLALAVGVSVITVGKIRSRGLRFLVVIMSIPVIAYLMNEALRRVGLERGLGSAQARQRNVDIRLDLWEISLNSFLSSPIAGSGFGGLRQETFDTLGIEVTHAHNLPISLLQQSGLFALPLLLLLLAASIKAFQRGSVLERGAIAALTVIVLVEPFFEGFLGAFVGAGVATSILSRRNGGAVVHDAKMRPTLQTSAGGANSNLF